MSPMRYSLQHRLESYIAITMAMLSRKLESRHAAYLSGLGQMSDALIQAGPGIVDMFPGVSLKRDGMIGTRSFAQSFGSLQSSFIGFGVVE